MMNMRKVSKAILPAVISLGLMAGSAFGRTRGVVKFSFTQDVTVNGVILPAGAYSVHDVGSENGMPVLVIHSDNGARVTTFARLVPLSEMSTAKQTSVVLRHDGTGYQLEQIRIEGHSMGYRVPAAAERN